MKTKIKRAIAQIKHVCSNVNYKIRYKNLLKKYETLEEEHRELEKKLSKEYISMQLKQAQQEAIMYKRQRDKLRQDYMDLQCSTTKR